MENLSQTNVFSQELQRLKGDVTKNDRKDAMSFYSIKSSATISQYLNGIVRDNDTAANLISFFKSRIQKRNEVLA